MSNKDLIKEYIKNVTEITIKGTCREVGVQPNNYFTNRVSQRKLMEMKKCIDEKLERVQKEFAEGARTMLKFREVKEMFKENVKVEMDEKSFEDNFVSWGDKLNEIYETVYKKHLDKMIEDDDDHEIEDSKEFSDKEYELSLELSKKIEELSNEFNEWLSEDNDEISKLYKTNYEVEYKVNEIKESLEKEINGRYDINSYANDELRDLQNKLVNAQAEDEYAILEEITELLKNILISDMEIEED